jgi:hypothetical protein
VEDYVLMRPADTNNLPYMARVERMESDRRGSSGLAMLEHEGACAVVMQRGGSARTRTKGAVEPRVVDIGGH